DMSKSCAKFVRPHKHLNIMTKAIYTVFRIVNSVKKSDIIPVAAHGPARVARVGGASAPILSNDGAGSK
ncbi:MAG: hypothetical protein KJO55_09820, partial [Gammaproteobacteria bacterium]|nr:hypothetical protein [Gammaproteobacteria bacterium]